MLRTPLCDLVGIDVPVIQLALRVGAIAGGGGARTVRG